MKNKSYTKIKCFLVIFNKNLLNLAQTLPKTKIRVPLELEEDILQNKNISKILLFQIFKALL